MEHAVDVDRNCAEDLSSALDVMKRHTLTPVSIE